MTTHSVCGVDPLVPSATHYDLTYLRNGRLHSLATQVEAVLECAPGSVLEVGVGTGISAFAMRTVGIDVTTLDIQAELAPDLLGDVRAIPAQDGAFDVACCCQVLEHLPFGDFDGAARELRRVSRMRVVLSLPDITRYLSFSAAIPWFGRRRLELSIPCREPSDAWKSERMASMGHYWEIGLGGIRASTVAEGLRSAGFESVRSFRVPELPWHRFFVADVR